jgi:hypothetical protein
MMVTQRGPLLPVPDLAGPKIFLGLLWALGTFAAVLLGPVLLALWMAPFVVLAAAQIARTWKDEHHPLPAAAMGGAAVIVLLSPFGLIVFAVGVAAGVVVAAAWASSRQSDVLRTVTSALVPAVAAAGPVLLRSHGLVAALVLVTYALLYDAASWVVGSGTRRHWLGPLAGMACIASVTVGIAGVFPQFKGTSAWDLGVLAMVLAPIGPVVATLALGSRARVPAWRRLDSLLVLGPLWALAAAVLMGG